MSALILALLGVVVLAGIAMPYTRWLEARVAAQRRGRPGETRAAWQEIRFGGALQPVADGLRSLATPGPAAPGALAASVAWLGALATLAILPVGSRYAFGSEPISPVLADLEAGLWVPILASAAVTLALVAWAAGAPGEEAARARARAVVRRALAEPAFALALLSLAWSCGTLRPVALVASQDALQTAFGVPLPAWGAVVQPAGFVIAIAAWWLRSVPSGAAAGEPTATRWPIPASVELPAGAALLVVAFLGGGALPWLPQERIVGLVAPAFGAGFATGLCLLLHVGVFVAKVAGMIALLVWLQATLPRIRHREAIRVAGRLLVPLALANAIATLLVVARFGSVGGACSSSRPRGSPLRSRSRASGAACAARDGSSSRSPRSRSHSFASARSARPG